MGRGMLLQAKPERVGVESLGHADRALPNGVPRTTSRQSPEKRYTRQLKGVMLWDDSWGRPRP